MTTKTKTPEDGINIKDYPHIEVVWADHWTDPGDFELAEIISNTRAYYGKFLGYKVHETKQMIVLVRNIWEDGSVSDPMYIMKRSIISRSDKPK